MSIYFFSLLPYCDKQKIPGYKFLSPFNLSTYPPLRLCIQVSLSGPVDQSGQVPGPEAVVNIDHGHA
jgi:hypothetical protein